MHMKTSSKCLSGVYGLLQFLLIIRIIDAAWNEKISKTLSQQLSFSETFCRNTMTQQSCLWTNYGLQLKISLHNNRIEDWIQWLQIQQKIINEITILMTFGMGSGHVCKLNFINLNKIAVIGNTKQGTQTE